jgi:hypothetical protein
MMPTVAVKQVSLLGASPAMQSIQADIDSAARTDAKVLLTGETGTGKDILARDFSEGLLSQRWKLVAPMQLRVLQRQPGRLLPQIHHRYSGRAKSGWRFR